MRLPTVSTDSVLCRVAVDREFRRKHHCNSNKIDGIMFLVLMAVGRADTAVNCLDRQQLLHVRSTEQIGKLDGTADQDPMVLLRS